MKIYINGRFLTQHITGVQRYALEMTRAIDQMLACDSSLKKYHFILIAPKNTIQDVSFQHIAIEYCGRMHGHLWEQIELPYYTRDGFLLNFCNCAPLVKKNQYVTIHDAAVAAIPDAYSWKFRSWYKIIYTILGKRLNTIFTVSHFSASELHRYFNIPSIKLIVTYNGTEHLNKVKANDNIIRRYHLNDKKYVFAVGSKSPSKNFRLILATASKMPDTIFVVAGGTNNNVFSKEEYMHLENVIYTGYVTDEELCALYQNAAVFVYPSLYEGFGIPPLEAMSFGCPVIISDIKPLLEICGNAALCYNSSETDISLVKLINQFITDENIRNRYSVLGRGQVNLYHWNIEVKKIINALPPC